MFNKIKNEKSNLFFSFVIKIIFSPLYVVSFFIPKNDKIWIFGSASGNIFNDNSKYLYEFISKNQEYKAIWLTKNREIISRLNKEKKICYHFYSLRGIGYSLVAKYIFLSYSYDDVSFFCYLFSQKTKIIQLFHGTPLKKLEIEKSQTERNIFLRNVLRSYVGRKYDLITSASDLVTEKMDIYFKAGKEKYIVSGYPRNDVLLEKKESTFLIKLKNKINFSKVIFYLPTYREYLDENVKFNLFDNFKFDQEKMERILERNNAVMLIKLHSRDYEKTKKIIEGLRNSRRVYFIKNDEIGGDIYPLLANADILITDYSSVYFDFLLLDRPIIFAAFDKDKYEKKDRGFYFNYNEVTPGSKVNNWDELCEKLEESLNKPDIDKQKRFMVNANFNKFIDNKSSQRIFNFLTMK